MSIHYVIDAMCIEIKIKIIAFYLEICNKIWHTNRPQRHLQYIVLK